MAKVQGAVKEALSKVEVFTSEKRKKALDQLTKVNTKIERIKVLLRNLWPIESSEKKGLELKLAKLQQEQQDLWQITGFSHHFNRLSLEPLGWRDEQGLPRLVVFSLDQPTAAFDIELINSWDNKAFEARMNPELPDALIKCYKDVLEVLAARAKKLGKSIKLTCQFSGLIPLEVKERIEQVRDMFEGIYIIAEPASFNLETREPTVLNRDPIVVGYSYGTLWHITDFETTAIEEAAIFETPKK